MQFNPTTVRLSHPCAFAWEDLASEEKDRYCHACSKHIVDFTKFTDAELVDYFKHKPSGICGRFSDNQLNRNLHPNSLHKLLFYGRKFAAAFLLAFAGQSATAQVSQQTRITSVPSSFSIRGLVLLEGTSNPAAHAKISVFDKDKLLFSFVTDAAGKYLFNVDSNTIPEVSHIIIESADNRVRYEEDVLKSELLNFFNRAIPFYNRPIATVEIVQTNPDAVKISDKKKNHWNPFRKKKIRTWRPIGCPEF